MIGRKTAGTNFTRTFILLSFGAFLLLAVFLFIVIPRLFDMRTTQKTADANMYLKNTDAADDPLLTAVPKLKDIIAGPILSASDPALGPTDAPVTITIYTDFSCWYCGQTIALAQKLLAEFPKEVRLMHKDFPNANKAYASYQAAIAGRCAQAQDTFWDVSEQLYKNYNQLDKNKFITIAKEAGLNATQFENCLNGKATTPVITSIDDDIAEANALGIVGVPLVYVNNHELPAEVTYEELKAAVERELAQ
jgi:protein-disulfide isomerase